MRKPPIRHKVKTFQKNNGTIVNSFVRGSDSKPKIANPVLKGKPLAMFRMYFDSKSIMHNAVRNLSETYPTVEVFPTDMDQLQWLDVYGTIGRNFLLKNYKSSITSVDRISLTKPKVDKPIWAKGMHKEAWYWVDRRGKKWEDNMGQKTEVNLNKRYI